MLNRSKLAVILHADVVGSTALVHRDERVAHERIQEAFQRISKTISAYTGITHEVRGDALVAEFERASDAVSAALAFQAENQKRNDDFSDNIRPEVRVGIALGEVIVADQTITGTGVILAQRLEQLAEPHGLCISAAIREALPARLPFEYRLLGEQAVKGFDEPIRVFLVALGDSASIPSPEPVVALQAQSSKLSKIHWFVSVATVLMVVAGVTLWLRQLEPVVEPADPTRMALKLPDKPSVAVLPFENISKDKSQEFFSDGITEDIITDLSKVSGLFVVARNSTFTYKGEPIEIRQVAEDLGVHYVLEGSVRRSGDRIRINAQLIDALKGEHIWANRYDRNLEDVFAIQSEVAQHVAKALSVTIQAGEHDLLFLKNTTSIDAYEAFLRARRMVDAPSKDNILRGESLFTRAIDLDPEFAGAYAGLSFNYSVKARFSYGDSPDDDIQRSLEAALKAVELDDRFAWGYIALGGAHLANGDPNAAVEAARDALVIQPNGYEVNLFIGLYSQFAGEPAQAVEHLEFAQRLSPIDTARKLGFLGMAYFMNGDYAKAAKIWKTRIDKIPKVTQLAYIFLAMSYAMLGQTDAASSATGALLTMNPNFHLSGWRWPRTYKNPEDRQRLYDAAVKAGIPENPST
jgi:adenylate cyclase